MKIFYYKDGYKYQLARNHTLSLDANIWRQLCLLNLSGVAGFIILNNARPELTIKKGYAWDGVSGAPDLKTAMRAALVHDALYQVLRNSPQLKKRKREKIRKAADELFRDMMDKDGTPSFVVWVFYNIVRTFGKSSADPKNVRPILCAP